MTGLKNKNGASRWDKLKMGIGESERTKKKEKEENVRMPETDMERNEKQRENVRLLMCCCFAEDAALAPAHSISSCSSLAQHLLSFLQTIILRSLLQMILKYKCKSH